jgi:RNA polymerase sigma factor (sigma-70 family)
MKEQETEALRPLNDDLVALLVDNHRKFRAFLSKRLSNDALAEDLLQLSMRKALESRSAPQGEESVVAWFYRILRNTVIDHYRSHAAEQRKNEEFLQALSATGQTHSPSADEVEAAICECFQGLLPTLKESYREALERVDLRNEPIRTVAESLGVSESNLNVRLHRARQALKLSLERTCGTCTEHGCLNCTCD